MNGSEKKARNEARKVAAVPLEELEDYVSTAAKPSLNGLLNRDAPPKPPRRTTDDLFPDALKAVKNGLTREAFARNLGLKHDSLPLVAAYAMAKYEVMARRAATAKPTSWDGKSNDKRRRELQAVKRASKGLPELARLSMDINKMCVILEDYDFDDYDLDDATDVALWDITSLLDDLISLGEWHARALLSARRWLSEDSLRLKIDKLRNTTGRTPEEAETALRLADRLEQKRIEARTYPTT